MAYMAEAWAVHAPERAALCANCLDRPEKPPAKCATCHVLRYCSRRCQMADWQSYHKQECKSLARLLPQIPGPSLLLASRLLRRVLVEASQKDGDMQGGKYFGLLEGLQHHEDALTVDRRSLLRDMASLVREIVQGDERIDKNVFEALDPDYVVRLICRISCNAMTIQNPECQPLGIGIYLGAVAANHSCRPNCFALFDGPILRLRTIQPVEKGMELCIAYVDLSGSKASRQEELKCGYFFECQCIRCQSAEEAAKEEMLEAWLCPVCGGACVERKEEREVALFRRWKAGEPLTSGTEPQEQCARVCQDCGKERHDVAAVTKELAQAEKVEKDGFEMYNQAEVEGAVRFYKKAYAVYEKYLHPLHSSRYTITAKLGQLSIGLQDWTAAREYSRATLRNLEYIMPPGTPLPALEHLLLGKLEWHMDDADSALVHLLSAVQVLRVTHGDNYPLVQTAIDLIREVQAARRLRGP